MTQPWTFADQPNRYDRDTSEVGGGAGLDLPPHLVGVLCSRCHKPLTRKEDGPIGCWLDEDLNPVCYRPTCRV